MKPRTKLQFEVMRNYDALPKRAGELKPWAISECLDHLGHATKNRVICMDCGGRFPTSLVQQKRAVCPNCGQKLKIVSTSSRTHSQYVYFAVAEVFRGFQVIRSFYLSSRTKDGEAASYKCYEILQHWIREDGKREVISRNHNQSWYMDSWTGSMEIRGKNNLSKYDVYPRKLHPSSEFKPEFMKYGIDHRLQGLSPLEAIRLIPQEPNAETLLKARQYPLLEYFFYNRKKKIHRYWPSIKICFRNKYTVKDADMWIDYLDMLDENGKDLRNAHYVCPKNLKREHDQLMDKKQKKEIREKIFKNNGKFKKFIQPFLDLCFVDKDIKIRPLKSIEEFAQEGDKLHHCVFSSAYYNRTNSLIFSARINNKPIETIEFSLHRMEVVQCHGRSNLNSIHHNRILRIMDRNKKHIAERVRIKQSQ